MESKIPKEIQQSADKLYPEPNRADYHTDTEYECGMRAWLNNGYEQKMGYINGRVEGQNEAVEFADWIKLNKCVHSDGFTEWWKPSRNQGLIPYSTKALYSLFLTSKQKPFDREHFNDIANGRD